jgi:hypothetical protein
MNGVKMECLRLKGIKEKRSIEKLCNEIRIDFNKIVGFDPKLEPYGTIEESNYVVYAHVNSSTESKYRVTFQFKVFYDNSIDFPTGEDRYAVLDYEEAYMQRKALSYVFIDNFRVKPEGTGVGTQLINLFIRRIKNIKSLKKVYLISETVDAERFWIKCGFRYLNEKDLNEKTMPKAIWPGLVYDLDIECK